jgi:hypothetical protein
MHLMFFPNFFSLISPLSKHPLPQAKILKNSQALVKLNAKLLSPVPVGIGQHPDPPKAPPVRKMEETIKAEAASAPAFQLPIVEELCATFC